MHTYHVQYNIGKTRYVLCYDDGATYCDGSICYMVKLCHTKQGLNREVAALKAQGYTEHNP